MTVQKSAVAYLRTYTEEQAGDLDLEHQEKRIRQYAERNDYEIVQFYRDNAASSTDKCPGFERMLLDAQTGQFSTILVLDASRLFYNVALASRYVDELRCKLGIEIVFVHELAFDTTGFTAETLNELFEEYTLHELRLRTTLGKQVRAQRGLFNGTLPFGYRLDEDGVPVPHPTDSLGLVMAFNAYSTGQYTDAQIADLLNREGYHTTGNWGERPFTKDTVNRILQNVFYLGVAKYKGETFPGQHPALIDQSLFDRCQEVRARRARKPKISSEKKRVYALAGIARCSECGLTLRSASTSRGGQWRYYRHAPHDRGHDCSVPHKMIRADHLEQQWSDILSAIQLSEEWMARVQEMATAAGHSQNGTESLETLWAAATQEEQRAITQMLLKALYVDVQQEKIIAVEPQPVLKAVFDSPCQALGIAVR